MSQFVQQNLGARPLTARVFDQAVRPMLPQLLRLVEARVQQEPEEVRAAVSGSFESFVERTLVDGGHSVPSSGSESVYVRSSGSAD